MATLVSETRPFLLHLRRTSWREALLFGFAALAGLALILFCADALALFYLYSFHHDPKHWTNINVFHARPKQAGAGRVAPEQAVLGALLVRGNDHNSSYAIRYNLTLDDIKPSALHDCLLAAEDKRFYRHSGIDYFSVASAILKHFVIGNRLRGASTVSNQLIGEVILADRSRKGLRAYWRKIEEIILTSAAERHFSKEDLLVAYFNNVPVGHVNGVALIGFSAASEILFGKRKVKALTLSEACTLAGMLNQPNTYINDALKSGYGRIKARRETILARLAEVFPERYPPGVIDKAKKEEIRLLKNNDTKPDLESRRLINYANQQLETRKPGLRIYLTVDHNLQRAAENAVNEKLADFDRGSYGSYNQLSYRHAIKEGRTATEEQSKLQAALVALDPKTGGILAMVGGRNSSGEYNRATQAKRTPGSLIKTYVYLHGIHSGVFDGAPFRADTIIDPTRTSTAERYTTGGAGRARIQLARSDNGAAVAIAREFGISRVRSFVAKATGTSPMASEMLAIGGGKGIELSVVQVAQAYTIFPNNGVKVAPNVIWVVCDNDKKLKMPEAETVRVIDPGAPFVITRMLQSVVGDGPDGQYGTARIARKLAGLDSTVALAGKTGTGDNDLWFVGFTPRVVVVVWVGFDNNFPKFEMSKGFKGSELPLQIWTDFMRNVKKYRSDLLKGNFEMPLGVRELTIDPQAGCVSETGIKEYFLADRLPPDCY
jgi:membrane peptidoglycan carboxypeptidase